MSTPSDANVVEKLSLHGKVPAQVVLAQFDSGQISSPTSRAELLRIWNAANQAFILDQDPTQSFVRAEETPEFDGVTGEELGRVLARLRNYAPFDSHPPAICWVPVSKIVTPQLVVSVPRLARRARLSGQSTSEELFELMFKSGPNPEPVYRQTLGIAPNGGAILYTSSDEDVRLHQPPLIRKLAINEQDSESPNLEAICFPVGGGLPFAYAFRVQLLPGVSRLILANGIHRAVAAAQAGIARVPLALCDMSPIEVPDPFVETPRGLLLDPGTVPPMISDFADSRRVMPLSVFRPLRTVRFNWNLENYSVSVR